MATSGYAHFEIEGRIEEVIEILEPKFGGCFTRSYTHNGRCILAVLLGQKYYFWMGNNEVAVSIILRAEDYLVLMEVIGFAGGTGAFSLDYGHNKEIIHEVEDHLRKNGFKITRTYFTEISEHSGQFDRHYPRIENLITYNP